MFGCITTLPTGELVTVKCFHGYGFRLVRKEKRFYDMFGTIIDVFLIYCIHILPSTYESSLLLLLLLLFRFFSIQVIQTRKLRKASLPNVWNHTNASYLS